ncbi:hypothetical protein E1263_02745 [Kribbella antibiotica]|uniref:Uncharacterized protein n=1 Tax=Kribbella antibiotica TaxID=190195 RepID=A0A4R4ZZP1_9ACTN|nr:hypothetical protein [Kribbella antibiotica]TDD62652.1 hypothetical protein E1263_02745 [Kribbella antibiotica]
MAAGLKSRRMIAAAGAAVVLLAGCSGEKPDAVPTPSGPVSQSTPAPTVTNTQPPTTSTPPGTSVTPPAPTAPPTVPPSSSAPGRRVFRYQAAWPFTSEARAGEWQRSYRSGGHQPWHLDAGETALSFTQGFLGFKDLKLITSRSIRGDEAYVGVGYQIETGRKFTAAVLHLVRIGQGGDAPWEVVGTRDSDLSLTTPRYGATAGSPLTAGGRITGVDEAIRIEVRQASTAKPLGTLCCVPAGGERSPWTGRVTFRGATDPALIVVASAGGHNQRTERFAITAVRRS